MDPQKEVEVAKLFSCMCGFPIHAETDDELWEKALSHLQSVHPDLVGKVTRAEVVEQAELL